MNTKMSMGALTKIVNIIFLIVLQNFVLDSAMGFFAVPLLLYYVVYTAFFNSLQDGIAKMVSIRNNKGINGNSKRIVKPALGYVVVFGSFITVRGIHHAAITADVIISNVVVITAIMYVKT